jgi:wyosine [tRNA(Phe)-imidazoG37] synthetase (radical SAM superfamily)
MGIPPTFVAFCNERCPYCTRMAGKRSKNVKPLQRQECHVDDDEMKCMECTRAISGITLVIIFFFGICFLC